MLNNQKSFKTVYLSENFKFSLLQSYRESN